MTRSVPYKISGVVIPDAASDLKSSGVSGKSLSGHTQSRLIVGRCAGIQQYDMTAGEPVTTKELRKMRSSFFANEIFPGMVSLIPEGAAHDLFYFSVMDINTRPKLHTTYPITSAIS